MKKSCPACEAEAQQKSRSKTVLVMLFVMIGFDVSPMYLMASLCKKHGKRLGSMLVRIGAKPVVDSAGNEAGTRFH